MTLQAVAGFLGQAGIQHPALLYRNLVGALAGKRSGFVRYNDFTLTPSGSAMQLTVGAGDAVIMGTEAVTTQGGYYVWNNTNEVLAWPAATTLPRIDSLILRVIDTDYGADAAGSKAVWEIVSGTAAASPVAVADSAFAPAGAFYHPGAWLRVANFTVPASSTNLAAATLDHKRKYARVGRHTMALSTDLPTDAQLGDQVTVINGTDLGSFFTYDGTSWNTPYQGFVNYTPTVWQALSTTPTAVGAVVVNYARYRKVGKLCKVMVYLTINTTTSGGCAVLLPFAAAQRFVCVGSHSVTGTSPPSQVGSGRIAGAAAVAGIPMIDKVIGYSNVNNFVDVTTSGQALQFDIEYETV